MARMETQSDDSNRSSSSLLTTTSNITTTTCRLDGKFNQAACVQMPPSLRAASAPSSSPISIPLVFEFFDPSGGASTSQSRISLTESLRFDDSTTIGASHYTTESLRPSSLHKSESDSEEETEKMLRELSYLWDHPVEPPKPKERTKSPSCHAMEQPSSLVVQQSQYTSQEDQEEFNANLDVVASRDSFEDGESLNFMASSRIHYYKLSEQEELFINSEQPSAYWSNYQATHLENLRNIIMAMSNSFGGLILFGLGKQKSVQGVTLDAQMKANFVKLIDQVKSSIHNSDQLSCKVQFLPIYRLVEAGQSSTLIDEHLFGLPSLVLFSSDSAQDSNAIFEPFCSSSKSKDWICQKYIVRIVVEQGAQLESTYVHIRGKEMVSAIFDRKLKIFKPIYGEPLLNKIIQKAICPSIEAQKIYVAEPNAQGVLASKKTDVFRFQSSSGKQTSSTLKKSIISVEQQEKQQTDSNWNHLYYGEQMEDVASNISYFSQKGQLFPLTQEAIKQKRGQKIINDTKKRLIKEKNQRYSQQTEERAAAKKSSSQTSVSATINATMNSAQTINYENSMAQIVSPSIQVCSSIEFIGFEHSGNATQFQQLLETQFGVCPFIEAVVQKYDTLLCRIATAPQKPQLTNNSMLLQKPQQSPVEWMEKVKRYLLDQERWRELIRKEKLFKKMLIDDMEYLCEDGSEWVSFQNVKSKRAFVEQFGQLQKIGVVEQVNFFHQYVFRVQKVQEFEDFCQGDNKSFAECFVSEKVKKGYSSSRINVKSLKNTPKAIVLLKSLMSEISFKVTVQGTNFVVLGFKNQIDSYLAFERLINHRKQKFLLDLFATPNLDASIELLESKEGDFEETLC